MLTLIWYVGTAAIPAILLLMALRHTFREFPCFGIYLSTTLLWSLVMLRMGNCCSHAYSRAYFIGGAMMFASQIGSVYELLTSLFIRKHRFFREFCCVSVSLGVVCFALSFFTFNYASVSYIELAERLVRWTVFSGLGYIILKRREVGLLWRKRPAGILLGLLVTLSTDTIVAAIIPSFHTPLVRSIGPLLYFIAAVIWILTFVRKDTTRIKITLDAADLIVKQSQTTIFCALTELSRQQQTPRQTKSERGVSTR